MSSVADQLGEKIEQLQEERQQVAMERRKTLVRSRNEKAKRLVNRLEDCDENIANLLSQAANCLQNLIKVTSSSQLVREEEERKQVFEAKAQEWFACLHEVQIGLRSAVKNLRKAQLAPVVQDASTNASSATSKGSGSASRGHSLGLLVQRDRGEGNPAAQVDAFANGPEMQSSDEEAKMSLSALRLQDAGWKQLAQSLEELAACRTGPPSDSGSSDQTVAPTRPAGRRTQMSKRERQEVRMVAQELVKARSSQDSRLLDALFPAQLPPARSTKTQGGGLPV